jgi:hypothetical protein
VLLEKNSGFSLRRVGGGKRITLASDGLMNGWRKKWVRCMRANRLYTLRARSFAQQAKDAAFVLLDGVADRNLQKQILSAGSAGWNRVRLGSRTPFPTYKAARVHRRSGRTVHRVAKPHVCRNEKRSASDRGVGRRDRAGSV